MKKALLVFALTFLINASFGVDWLDSDWDYRNTIVFNASETGVYSACALITITPNMSADGSDVRFTKDDGLTLINQSVSPYNNGTELHYCIRDNMSVGDNTYYFYYGNALASEVNNESAVFLENASLIYDFYEGSGSTIHNSLSSGSLIPNATAFGVDWYDTSVYFGGNDRVQVVNYIESLSTVFGGVNKTTWCVQLVNNQSADDYVLWSRSNTSNHYLYKFAGNGLRYAILINSIDNSTDSPLEDNVFHAVCAVRNETALQIVYDGSVVAYESGVFGGYIDSVDDESLFLGTYWQGDNSLNYTGYLQRVMFYTGRDLSLEEIQMISLENPTYSFGVEEILVITVSSTGLFGFDVQGATSEFVGVVILLIPLMFITLFVYVYRDGLSDLFKGFTKIK